MFISFLLLLNIYMRGDNLGHVTQVLLANFCSAYQWRLNILTKRFGEKMFVDCEGMTKSESWLYFKLTW